MSFLKTLFWKISRIFLAVMGAIRRAFCCRRRHYQNEGLLPITVGQLNSSIQTFHLSREPDLQTWEWNEEESAGTIAVDMNHSKLTNGSLSQARNSFSETNEEEGDEDYFKDMVPEFRRPKKYIVQHLDNNMNTHGLSSRLSLDAKTPVIQSELGTLDENSTTWEDATALDDVWDPDAAVRDKRKAERERRLAEHQRRKQERESTRIRRDNHTIASKLS